MLKIIFSVILICLKIIAVFFGICLFGLIVDDHKNKNLCDMTYHGIFLILIFILLS